MTGRSQMRNAIPISKYSTGEPLSLASQLKSQDVHLPFDEA